MSSGENQINDPVKEPTAPESEKIVVNDEEHFAFNPNILEVENADPEDLERIRGDAIGDTLYSERFVLNTLLKLSKLEKNLQDEKAIEKDLCTLWDMTLDTDVIEYLLKQDVLTLFAEVIKATNDKRLTEILVGILANMCDLKKTRDELCLQESQLVEVLLDLSGCLDALTLQQLMRLWAVIFVKSPTEHIEKWYELVCKNGQFIENICFILNNAINHKVLLQTLETLNAVLAKFALLENPAKSFMELFIKSEVTFCNIHGILTQYQQYSEEAYATNREDVLQCMKKILKPLALESDIRTWQTFELEVLDTLSDLLEILPPYFDPPLSSYLIKIWHKSLRTQQSCVSTEFEEELNYKDLSDKCLQLLLLVLTEAKETELQENLKIVQTEKVRFLKSLEKLEKNGRLIKAYDKIKNALEE
uniref:Beta-catenin-like protein 1 N-terminal domain-containing protein n=1 Tax=Glossina brevipalpis TaxID=37001 RepID=A0A1A9W9Q6_9MUSC